MKSARNCATYHIKHALVCQNKKENMHRSSISSPHKNFIIMFARLYKTANVLRASSFVRRRLLFYYLLRCHAAIQRDRDWCDLYRLCFGNDFAHFLFVYIYRSSPLKIKAVWAAKSYQCIRQ